LAMVSFLGLPQVPLDASQLTVRLADSFAWV